MLKTNRVLIATFLLLAFSTFVFAQSQASTGQIVGTVKNPNGELVPGATLPASNPTFLSIRDSAGNLLLTNSPGNPLQIQLGLRLRF